MEKRKRKKGASSALLAHIRPLVLLSLASQSRSRTCNIVEDFGAAGDGLTFDDAPLSLALAACQSITFPGPGQYLLSPFNISSNQELVLEAESVLLAATSIILVWPLVMSYPSYEPGIPTILNRPAPFIGAPNATNVIIRGTGTIDGQGSAWWNWDPNEHNGTGLAHGRPRLVEPTYCTNFTMQGVHIMNPPFWAVHPYACDGVVLEDLTFSAPFDSPNTDGLDPDSCFDVIIRNFTFLEGGDDAVAIKSGRDEWGRAYGRPSRNIFIEGGTMNGGRGVNIGSEMSGGVYNVTVRGVTFHGSEFAVRVKAGRGRGGLVSGVAVEDVTVHEVTEACLALDLDYGSDSPPAGPTAPTTPHVQGVALRSASGSVLGLAGVLRCLPEAPCVGIAVGPEVNLTLARRPSEGHPLAAAAGRWVEVPGWACVSAFGAVTGDVAPEPTCLEAEAL